MFVLNDSPNCGTTITFENEYEISIQWGKGNYCDNRYIGLKESKNAEVAIFFMNENVTNKIFSTVSNDLVLANITPNQLVKIMDIVSRISNKQFLLT